MKPNPKILPTRDTEVSYLVHLMDSMIAGKGGKELAAIAKKLLLEISKRSPVEASGQPINVEDEDVVVEDAQVIQEQEPLDLEHIEVKDDKVELVVKPAVNENENIEVCVIDNLDLFDNITPRASKDNLGDVDHYY